MTNVNIHYLIMIGLMIISVSVSDDKKVWIEESEPNLRERLDRIKSLKNDWPLKAQLFDQLPSYNYIFCEPTHGRKGAKNEICHAENICYNIQRHQIEVSKKGLEEFNNFFAGTDYYQESFFQSFAQKFKTTSNVRVVFLNDTKETDSDKEKVKVIYIENPTLLFKRFVPNNLMHVLHDDLFPILLTIAGVEELLSTEDEELSRLLVSTDPYGIHFKDAFDWFGKHHNIYHLPGLLPKNENVSSNSDTEITHICFKSAVLGLRTSAQWYQYGMIFPQGPVRDLNPKFVGENVRIVTDWLKERLGLTKATKSKSFISIVSRKKNRLILNEDGLIKAVQKAFPEYTVRFISEEMMSTRELIAAVDESVGLIGMHGAMLSLAQFLPPNSCLIEIYPFGIDPKHYTPYKTLTELPGMKITYKAWVNPHEEAPYNIDHTSAPFYNGGIAHLPLSYQNGIKATKIVPIHKCCYSPFWYYRIYQDTYVNTTDIINLLLQSIDRSIDMIY